MITGSPITDIEGKPVARIGDKATCPKCKGTFPIVSGDATFVIDGQPVARERDYLACGCRLLSARQVRVFLDGATSDSPAADAAMLEAVARHAARYKAQFRAVEDATGKPVAGQPYRIELANGTSRTGCTDESGLTDIVSTAAPEEVWLTWLDVWHGTDGEAAEDDTEGC